MVGVLGSGTDFMGAMLNRDTFHDACISLLNLSCNYVA